VSPRRTLLTALAATVLASALAVAPLTSQAVASTAPRTSLPVIERQVMCVT
jgi:hypothetical protein